MTTYSFPSITPSRTALGVISNTKTFASPLSGSIQVASRNGTRLELQMSFDDLITSDRSTMQGFLAQLNGQENFFTVQDHTYNLQGTGNGTPKIDGASQTGKTLATDGWANSEVVLKQGDQISFDNGSFKELKIVTADVTSSGTGTANIPIVPEIHTSPADNAAIEVTTPIGTFVLAQPEISWTTRAPQLSSFEIRAIEVIV